MNKGGSAIESSSIFFLLEPNFNFYFNFLLSLFWHALRLGASSCVAAPVDTTDFALEFQPFAAAACLPQASFMPLPKQ